MDHVLATWGKWSLAKYINLLLSLSTVRFLSITLCFDYQASLHHNSTTNISANMPQYNTLPSNVAILQGTSPALTDLNGLLYVFYVGSKKEGVFYTTCDTNKSWSQPKLCTDPVKGSPSVVQFNGKIFLFYVPDNTTWMNYQVFDGKNWSKTDTIGHDATLLDPSSPAAVVCNERLFVFFNGSGNDGIWYKVYNGYNFEPQIHCSVPGLAMWQGSSPAPVAYQNKLYLFLNGAGNDGTWYTTFDGTSWSGLVSLRPQNNCSFEKGTSPTAFVAAGAVLVVMWSGSGKDGTWFSYSNGSSWTYQQSLNSQLSSQNLTNTTNAPGYYWGRIWICWSISGGTQIGQVDGAIFDPNTIKFGS